VPRLAWWQDAPGRLGALWLIDRPAALLLIKSPLGWWRSRLPAALTLAGFLGTTAGAGAS